jgi:hypothetical protein
MKEKTCKELMRDYCALMNRYDSLTDDEKKEFRRIDNELLDSGYDMNTYFLERYQSYPGK